MLSENSHEFSGNFFGRECISIIDLAWFTLVSSNYECNINIVFKVLVKLDVILAYNEHCEHFFFFSFRTAATEKKVLKKKLSCCECIVHVEIHSFSWNLHVKVLSYPSCNCRFHSIRRCMVFACIVLDEVFFFSSCVGHPFIVPKLQTKRNVVCAFILFFLSKFHVMAEVCVCVWECAFFPLDFLLNEKELKVRVLDVH